MPSSSDSEPTTIELTHGLAASVGAWLDAHSSLAPADASYVDRANAGEDGRGTAEAGVDASDDVLRRWSAELSHAGLVGGDLGVVLTAEPRERESGLGGDTVGSMADSVVPLWDNRHGDAIVHDALATRRLPEHIGALGVAVVGRLLLLHGSQLQQDAHLGPMLAGSAIWTVARSSQIVVDGSGRLSGHARPVGPMDADWLLIDTGAAIVMLPLDGPGIARGPTGVVFDSVQLGADALLEIGASDGAGSARETLVHLLQRHGLASGRARLGALTIELLELGRDRGATVSQREQIAAACTRADAYRTGAWEALSSAELPLATPLLGGMRRLEEAVVALACELLGAEGFLAPPNAPYAGVWAQRRTRLGEPTVVGLWPRSHPDPLQADSPAQLELRERARDVLSRDPVDWTSIARQGWLGARTSGDVPELDLSDEGVIHSEAGRALAVVPLWATARIAPFLPVDDQLLLATGEATWAMAEDPLVPNAGDATRIAVLGGDSVWEQTGALVEDLPVSAGARPLGVVVGGDVTRRLFATERLPELRRRSLLLLGYEALGVGAAALAARDAAGEPGPGRVVETAIGELAAARYLLDWEARLAIGTEAGAGRAKIFAAEAALRACDVSADDGDDELRRLLDPITTRARWLLHWEATPTHVWADLGAALLEV